jgi:predicted dehydrogenase
MKALVIGCGSIGRRHAANLRRLGVQDILVFDPDRNRCAALAREQGARECNDLEEAFSRTPKLALICAPTSLHVALATRAASHGCHLFIEKPLSHDDSGLDRLESVVKSKGLKTLVGCNMRFHPGLRWIKQALEKGCLGRLIAIRAEFGSYLPDWHPLETYRCSYSAMRNQGGGIILDAIHEIDYARWMLGNVNLVACIAGKVSSLEIETEDAAAILLRFHGGAIGEIHLDYVQRDYSRSCHIIGEEGTIRWDYKTGTVSWYSAQTGRTVIIRNPDSWEPNGMYLDEMRHFLGCITGGEIPTLDVFEGRRVLDIALAAKLSASSGKWWHLGNAVPR